MPNHSPNNAIHGSKGALLIHEILCEYKSLLGADYNRYLHHVLRIYFHCVHQDKEESNMRKYAIAATFHDLGIWTANTFDYLLPSIEIANRYLIQNGDSKLQEEVSLMIDFHHKRSPYNGNHKKTVETFRRSDWIDVSLGMIRFGVSTQRIKSLNKQYPTLGFHRFLIKKTILRFLSNPTNPLPMFKR